MGNIVHVPAISGLVLLASFAVSSSSGQAAAAAPPPAATGASVTVDVDLNRSLGPYRVQRWFGYDEENYTTAPNGRKLLGELHDLSPTPVYIRFHHLLTSGNGTPELKWSSTGVYREAPDGQPIYNFTILDGIFDALHAAGVRPLVEFGFMPEDLAATLPNRHQPYQVHFPGSTIAGASNNPPKNYTKWRELVRAVTAHFVQRYGRPAVLQWYFEVWNEPDIDYWHGSEEDYLRLYDYTVSGVRAALPDARVGGPATTGPSGKHAAEYLEAFLKHVESNRSDFDGKPIPLDFISFHAKGHPTFEEGHAVMGIRHELDDAATSISWPWSHGPSNLKTPTLLKASALSRPTGSTSPS
jgi:xylan 1,4-beta-xylosidase